MAHHVIEYDERCKSCGGTGLYVGMAEHDGIAVVCHTCKGTGCHHVTIEYDDFVNRIPAHKVKHVLATNPGISVGGIAEGQYSFGDFGGMPYADWANDRPFPPMSEMRKFTCPCWWYQSADYKLKPDWKECANNLGRTFGNCDYFATKRKCWERWDTEKGQSNA